ncbi:hypothetical protein ONS95_008741 [Cadophora gregata]|uniref:uncharacterized protein n=1 Tax=Cadophora gregata TaxID=51156 RepID=UPI0026DD4B1A|nr:uncharacterized protein ONS95_008741 [Cadophora gregata]KAK0123733.1 hypothetical protein ONS95_008741 [Cadophora gregata]
MERPKVEQEMEVAPAKRPSKSQLFVTRCLGRASLIKAKVLSVLPGAEVFDRIYNRVYSYMNRFEFLQLHWFAFLFWSLFSSLLHFGFQGTKRTHTYLNCLFFAVSAITVTGLAPENVSTLNTFQQILMCISFILGSSPLIGIVVLTVRRRSMEDSYGEIIDNGRRQEQANRIASQGPQPSIELATESPENATKNGEASATGTLSSYTIRTATVASNLMVYWREFLSKATVGRNATFHGLSRSQRESVVCAEYLSISLLRRVVACYAMILQLLGAIALAIFFQLYEADVIARDGVNPIALGIFNSISAFNNAGMSLMNNSMMPFKTSPFPVLVMSILMLAGNTGFPIFLRLTLWIMLKVLPRSSKYDKTRATITYTLKYPRRVYTHLFPPRETLFLLIGLLFLNGVDWVAFETSARDLPELKNLPLGNKSLDGLFQSLSVRCSGFNIVSVSDLSSGLLTLYIGMMYISAFPVTIMIRSSNVYEERSLGIYTPSKPIDLEENSSPIVTKGFRGRFYYITQQVRTQVSHDAWSIMLALVAITFIEGGRNSPLNFNVFPGIFEVFSAYANIGLSMGLSDQSYSLSGSWHWFSKVCLLYLMLQGRHRPLPNSIDRAIQLPDKNLGSREEADERERERELERELEALERERGEQKRD